jgi:multidrug efflux pump subunit AcrA (membrane-fusion protein)
MLGDGVLSRKHVRLGDVVKVPKRAVRIETPDHEREIPRQDKTQEESALPQGRGESLIAQLDSALNQAEQLREQQIQQQYSDQLGVYVQEKAEQIDRLQSSLAAALTSEQAQLQAIQQRAPGWTAGKKAHAQWEQQVARRKTRIAQIAPRLDRMGEIEEASGVSLMFSEIRRDKNNPMDHFCGRNPSTTKLSQEFERVKNSSKSRTSV